MRRLNSGVQGVLGDEASQTRSSAGRPEMTSPGVAKSTTEPPAVKTQTTKHGVCEHVNWDWFREQGVEATVLKSACCLHHFPINVALVRDMLATLRSSAFVHPEGPPPMG